MYILYNIVIYSVFY